MFLLLLACCVVSSVWGQSLDRRHASIWNPLDQGAACTSDTLNAAISSIGSAEVTLMLTRTNAVRSNCTWTFTGNVTLPRNITLWVPSGASVNLAGFTLTINGPTVLDDPDWITGSGSVVWGYLTWGTPDAYTVTEYAGYTLGGCLHGTSGSTTTEAITCTAWANNGRYINQPSSTITYSSGNGTYWLIAYYQTTGTVAGWTRAGSTHYMWQLSVTVPAIPAGAVLLQEVTVSGGAITAIVDQRKRRIVANETWGSVHTLGQYGTWSIPRGVTVTLNTGTVLTARSGFTLDVGNYGVFAGTGTISLPPSIRINPVWWTIGTGQATDPWVSTDNTAGFGGALRALQEYGIVKAPSGEYRVSGTAGVDKDNITIDIDSLAHIRFVADVPLLDLNTGAIADNTSSNNHTVTVRGGFFDTVETGALESSSTIRGTAIRARRIRNLLIDRMRCRRLSACIEAPIADTLTITNSFFRSSSTGILISNWMNNPGATPQDIWIAHNSFSSVCRLEGDDPDCVPMVAIHLATNTDSVHIVNNGIALNNPPLPQVSYFVRVITGTEDGTTSNVHITNNATEQNTLGTVIQVYDPGEEYDLMNMSVTGNNLGSSEATVLDLVRIAGFLRIEGNYFPSASGTGIKLDRLRDNAIAWINANRFDHRPDLPLEAPNPGKLWHITNSVGNSKVMFGVNSHHFDLPDDPLDIGTINAPTGNDIVPGDMLHEKDFHTSFLDQGRRPFTIRVETATISIEPWYTSAKLRQIADVPIVVTNITPTWGGHVIHLDCNNAKVTLTPSATLELAGDFACPENGANGESRHITIRYDDTNTDEEDPRWREVSRRMNYPANLICLNNNQPPCLAVDGAGWFQDTNGDGVRDADEYDLMNPPPVE
jgi:hypothetical protein